MSNPEKLLAMKDITLVFECEEACCREIGRFSAKIFWWLSVVSQGFSWCFEGFWWVFHWKKLRRQGEGLDCVRTIRKQIEL